MSALWIRCAALTMLGWAGFAAAPASAEVFTVTQQSYDVVGRLECVTVRMNPDTFGSLPTSACTLGTEGAQGPDRITRNVYDDAGQLTKIQRAVGTPLQQDYSTMAYTTNGQRDWIEDANGNRSDLTYDGFDRVSRLTFPSTTVGAHTPNTSDYEEYGYDANNNRTSLRLRSGESINYTYDPLNRETLKDIPGGTSADVYSDYDAFSRRLYAHFASAGGQGVDYAYDGLGRLETETSYSRAFTYQYDPASNRTRVTWPDTVYVQYTYDATNRMSQVQENGATSGAGLLAVYAYDNPGRRASITRGNGAVTSYAYDGISRLGTLTQDVAGGTTNDVAIGFTYTYASQVASRAFNTNVYDYAVPLVTRTYVADGLNRYSSVSGTGFSYDTRGNLTSDGSRRFCFDLENRLLGAAPVSTDPCTTPSTLALTYDPLGRLSQTTAASVTTDFLTDGDRLSGEYNGSTLLRRYVHGAGVDEPLVWYECAAPPAACGTSDRRYLITDHQGSVIAANGASTTIHSYSPYGEPNAWTGPRFRYTGQIALPEAALYHYKARVYDPVLGRFLQTDPVGYQDDLNLYAYVRNDPLNVSDPTGREGAGLWRDQDPLHTTPAESAAFQTQAAAVGNAALDLLPVIGDLKGGIETAQNPTPLGVIAVVVGLIPGIGDAGAAVLRNSDVVVRGGSNTAEQIARGSGVTTNADGTLSGVSVNSAPGASVEELSQGLPHSRVGVTTVGDIRAAGGDVTPSPTPNNPNHCTTCGITPQQAEGLFTPTIPNPNRRPRQNHGTLRFYATRGASRDRRPVRSGATRAVAING